MVSNVTWLTWGARATRREGKESFCETVNLQMISDQYNQGLAGEPPHSAAQRRKAEFNAECIRLLLTTVLKLCDKLVKVA
jgi:hypothetical protein